MSWFAVMSLGAGLILAGCAAAPPASPGSRACCQGAAPALAGTTNSLYRLSVPWQNDHGQLLHLSQLEGKPVVISMFYAACAGICVITKDDLKQIEASLPVEQRNQVRFVLVSLDSRQDSVEALKAYRVREELPEDHWVLLRGDPQATAQLAAQLGIQFGRDASGRFVHTSLLTVLDKSGKIILRQPGVHADLTTTVQRLSASL